MPLLFSISTDSETISPAWDAPCIKITCNEEAKSRSAVRSFCIGTDKIGHFFQVGYMLWEVSQVFDMDYARAFGDWTEGLYFDPPNLPPPAEPEALKAYQKRGEIDEWLKHGSFRFRGFSDTVLANYKEIWGGREFTGNGNFGIGTRVNWYTSQRSTADKAANEAGLLFWHSLAMPWFTPTGFDICGFISDAWVE